jgi:uncharacterized protein (DUF983 family)
VIVKKAIARTPDPCALRADAEFARGFAARMLPTEPLWKACDAPAGSCGAGRRRGFLTTDTSCRTCGSQLRVLKNQNRRAS